MTDKQAERYELLARFYEIQKAIDNTNDPETLVKLNAQKKELSGRLDNQH